MENCKIVAFLDLLGTSAIAKHGTDEEKANITGLLKRINDNYLSGMGVVVRDLGIGQQIIHNPEVFACSDSIILSADLPDSSNFDKKQIMSNLISKMVSIYWQGLHSGILIRGGVAKGECEHNGNMIFGEAYVRAVELEKATVFPRIEFDAGVIGVGDRQIVDDYVKSSGIKSIDEKYYLNCLGWHVGVWKDYFHFKYGNAQWPNGKKANNEIRRQIETIDQTINDNIHHLPERPKKKWSWFAEEWNVEKKHWPVIS